MLATPVVSLHSSPTPSARSYLLSSSRLALTDSTNLNTRSDVCGLGLKSSVYPTSSIRTGCSCSDTESSTASISVPLQSRHHHIPSAPSPFLVTYKAPPTVSISLSAACSRNNPGEHFYSSGVQGLEPDLPDVKSVVPFPSSQLDSDMDVEMLDGTFVPRPEGYLPPAGQVPRKRRSAHSSVSSQGSLGKDTRPKRQRKSKRQVAELWWLGVVHRSILRGIEARQSAWVPASSGLLSGPRDFDAMDHVLVERIQKRLARNGCVEGRLPSLLPRISSPSISVPSLNVLAPNRKTLDSASLTHSSQSNSNGALGRTATILPVSKAPPCASLSIISYPSIASSPSTSRRRHVHFEVSQRPRQPQSHLGIPRRSPSPPPRTGTVSPNTQTPTLTIPQLVASLTLARHEKSRLGMRGRPCKPVECGKNTGSLPSASCQVARCSDGDAIQDKKGMQSSFTLRARLSSTPERKSPLSRVAYAEAEA